MIADEKRITAHTTAVGAVWQRRSFLSRFVLICVILTAICVFATPSKYESTVSLMPPTQSPSSQLTGLLSGKMDADLGGLASGALGLKTQGALYIAILGSRTVQDAIINQFDLRKVYHARYMKDARKELDSMTSMDEATKSGIITITVTDRDRNRAAAIAAMYVKELNLVSVENNNTSAHLERVFLERRLIEVNQDLSDSYARLAQFSSKSLTFDSATQGKAMMDAGTDLQAKLIASEAELASLRQTLTDANPRVAAVQGTVDELRRQLNTMSSGTGGPGQVYPSLRELPLLGATYENLLRHVKLEEAVADLLTQQNEAAKVEEAKELPVVQVLDPPSIAERRSSPKRGTIIVGSVLFFFSLGVLLILLEAHWRALDPADPKKMLAAELAGYGKQIFSRHRVPSSGS
jgi:uncharacterized protein involved in exopolysaccharide biosynthesis